MAWTTYPLTTVPAGIRRRLGPTLQACQTLRGAFEAVDDELAIDWAQDLHRTARLPAALVGALVDPAMTGRLYDELTFPELLDLMSRLDEKQKAVIAALGGLDLPDIGNDDLDVCRAAEAQMRVDFNHHLRRIVDHPALAGWFTVTVPDDGRYQAVRPAGYTDTCQPSDLALYQRPQALKALPAPARAALIVVTTAYNDDIARDRFKGRGLKFAAGQGAAALWHIEDQALRNSVFGLLASYSGW